MGGLTLAAASAETLWIVEDGEGELHMVRGVGALKDLIAKHGLAKTATVYTLATTAKTVSELAGVSAPDAAPREPEREPEPPAPASDLVASGAEIGSAEASGQERDDELALFDRPFDDGEYFEDPPRSRWIRPAAAAALVVALGAGGYSLVHSRSVQGAPVASREHLAPRVAASASPPAEPVAVIQPAAPPASPPATPATVPADPGPPEPAGAAPVAPASVPAVRAPARAYPELVREGELQFQNGQSKRAQALFEQALAETPEGTAALVGLGYVELDRGKVSQATALFERALVQDRGDPTALFGLAESHRQGGNRRAALAEFQRFLTLRSTGNDADIARQLVQELSTGG
jgi:hypothetical protein